MAPPYNRVDLERYTQELEVIADWRDELATKIDRAKLCFEYVGLDADDQEQLHYEVDALKLVCTLLLESKRDAA